MEEFYKRIMRLFLSRHFLIFCAGVLFMYLRLLTGDQFCLLMLYVLGTGTIDKYKDNIHIGKE